MRSICCLLLVALPVAAEDLRGVVAFGGLPVPGATVAAASARAITNEDGAFLLTGLPAGPVTIMVEMRGFVTAKAEVRPGGEPAAVELEMLPLEAMQAQAVAPPPPAKAEAARPARPSEAFPEINPEDLARRAADGLLINGSAHNGAATPFAQSFAFGNSRRAGRQIYNGNLGVILGNSHLDAKPFSLTGQNTPRPDYNRVQGLFTFGGPLRIPGLIRNGPNVSADYQWMRQRNVATQSALMPTGAERRGDLGASGVIPASRISPQAAALLSFYPLPNFTDSRYNYQIPIVGDTHQDSLQSRFQHRLPRRNQVWGNFNYLSTRTDSPNIFQFLDTADTSGINTGVYWLHQFRPRLFSTVGYQYSRLNTRLNPFFANRVNVSGDAGIEGNNQEPANWGPPSLLFSGGIAGLSGAQFASNRNQTGGVTAELFWNRGRHNLTFGGGYRRQQFNVLSQEDPRGTFAFTGAAAGSDFAGFLLGIPDTSSIAFGNADKYLRAALGEAYFTDDYRIRSGLTVNVGLRWEYNSPVVERYGRLVNLRIAPGFAAAEPLVAGKRSPMRPDRNNFAPRIAVAWRPLAASSLIVRAGYGVYYDTSVYQQIAMQLAQQSPLSFTQRAEHSAANPLSLASGFRASSALTRNTFAVDPDFRIGYSQNWQLSLQRDLPAGLALVAMYSGGKGTRAQQQFLPNTFPAGSVNPCPACPAGFAYLVSNGNSTRHAGQIEIRRRLRAGLSAAVGYTYAKAIDNAAPGGRNQGGPLLAQNWLDLRSERGRSNFDQRRLLTVQAQYTTGMGVRSGMLLTGWRGRLLREWTITSQINAGTGLPLTPVYFAAVPGAGVTGVIRPDYTGAPLYAAPDGLFLNPAAYAPPASGRWGNAGRNTITGPSQFTLNASLGRVFRVSDRLNLDLRMDAANALNHPVFPGWNTTVTNSQFGLPNPANPMRTVQTTARLRF